jgi:hypothetical protein
MIDFFGKKRAYREYALHVETCLTELFGGFPDHILPSIRKAVDVDEMQQYYFKSERPAGVCAVLVARQIIGKAIEQMPQDQKDAAWASFNSDTPVHPLHFATGQMNDVAKRIADELYSRLLVCEVGGRLQGWTSEQIEALWTQGMVNDFSEMLSRG